MHLNQNNKMIGTIVQISRSKCMNDRVRSSPVPSNFIKTTLWLPAKIDHLIVLCMKFNEYVGNDHQTQSLSLIQKFGTIPVKSKLKIVRIECRVCIPAYLYSDSVQ